MPIARATAKKILLEAGAKRVSDKAVEAFADYLNRHAYSLATKAIKLAKHAKRKTIEKEDIDLAKA